MISFAVVVSAVIISFSIALFWLGIVNHGTGFLKWKNNNVFSLAMGGVAVVGIAGLLQFLLLEDNYLFNLGFVETSRSLENSLFFYVITAVLIEELLKGVVVWWGIRKLLIEKATKGMIVGIIVGLSFAVAENGIYFATQINYSNLEGIINIIVARTIFSSVAHMIFSGFMGFFISKAILSREVFGKTFFFGSALIFPIVVHAAFNAFISSGTLYWYSILILLAGMVGIFLVLRNHNKYL